MNFPITHADIAGDSCPSCGRDTDDNRPHCHGRTGRRLWNRLAWTRFCRLIRCECGTNYTRNDGGEDAP